VPEHLSAAQYGRLREQLDKLEGEARAEIVEAISAARSQGDLSENFEYQAAKDEQALLERRITILRTQLDGAVIVDAAAGDVIAVGASAVIEDDAGEQLEVEISNAGGERAVSEASPLGKALLGKRVGETAIVHAPRGTWKARIIEIHGE
jgi:transcription elongation factor GreA